MSIDRKIPAHRIELPNPFEKDPGWKDWMKRNAWWYHENLKTETEIKQSEDFRKLHDILLSIGGYETCFPDIEEDMEKILSRGYYRKGTSKMMVGRPSQCHANSAELWAINHRDHDVHICTGYALSEDGLWRQHTWLLNRYETKTQHREQIIETTTKRVAYFGYELTDCEAEKFVCQNP